MLLFRDALCFDEKCRHWYGGVPMKESTNQNLGPSILMRCLQGRTSVARD